MQSLPVARVVERAPGAGVLLLPGHRGRAVVEHEQHVAGRRRVVDHLDEPGDPAVHERRVAEHRHDPPRLRLRQRVAQPEPDADRGAHRDERVHRLGTAGARRASSSRCRRRRCSRACAAPRTPTWYGHAGQSSGGLPARRARGSGVGSRARIRRTRSTVELAEPVRARASPRPGSPAARIASASDGVALLDHDAALDRLGELADEPRSGAGGRSRARASSRRAPPRGRGAARRRRR